MARRSMVVAVVGLGAALAVAAASETGEIKWSTSYEEAKAAAQKSGKLMMIDFYGEH